MPTRFRADGNTGKIAIYDVPTVGSTDNAPLTNPRANLSRVRWHSDFSYMHEKSRFTASVALPQFAGRTQGWYGVQDFTLGAHGVTTGIPVILAVARAVPLYEVNNANPIGSRDVALLGTVPIVPACYNYGTVAQTSGWFNNAEGAHWWLHLGADATNVKLRGRYFVRGETGNGANYCLMAALTLSIDVLILQDTV